MTKAEIIIKEYEGSLRHLKAFQIKMQNLIDDLLKSKEIKVHNLSSRIKEKDSLEKKIINKKKMNRFLTLPTLLELE